MKIVAKLFQPVLYYKGRALFLVCLFLVLFLAYKPTGEFSIEPGYLWTLLDPVSAISSFFITLFILYTQAYVEWENSLEKRLSIEYVFENHVIAKIENAYLSGESDIRPWSQQLGKQMMGEMRMDMNWDEEAPQVIKEGKEYVKVYRVKIYLAENPLESIDENESFKHFKMKCKNYKHSVVEFYEEVGKPDVIWKRTDNAEELIA